MRRFFVTLALIAIVLAPFGVSASGNDRQIAEQIVRGLKHRQDTGDLQGFNIDLQVDKGSVWLKGHVSDPDQERLALEVARRVEGVQRVFNQIEVLESKDAATSAASSEEATTPPASEQVVSNRRVKRVEPAVAEAPVAAEEGTQNDLQLASTVREETESERKEAQQIAQQLVTKLRAEQEEGNLERFGIDIEVDKGVLWLKGQMASEEQRHLVLEIARRIHGVKQVVNDLSVDERRSEEGNTSEPSPQLLEEANEVEADSETIPVDSPVQEDRDSETLAREIIKRLQTAKKIGTLRDFGVDVQIDEGIVWMSGYVANKSQQTVILDIASHVAGVTQVVNDLSITRREEVQGAAEFAETLASHPVPVQLPSEPAVLPSRGPAAVEANPLRGFTPQGVAAPQVTAVRQGIAVRQAAPQGIPAAAPTYIPAQGQGRVIGYQLVRIDNPQLQQQTIQPVSNQLQTPMAFAPARPVQYAQQMQGQPVPMRGAGGVGVAPARYDHPQLPGYAWPSYAAHPNYGAVTYPRQYSAQAWPYIGPFYPYPQVPLGWRKVSLEWDDGWWQLDFKDRH